MDHKLKTTARIFSSPPEPLSIYENMQQLYGSSERRFRCYCHFYLSGFDQLLPTSACGMMEELLPTVRFSK